MFHLSSHYLTLVVVSAVTMPTLARGQVTSRNSSASPESAEQSAKAENQTEQSLVLFLGTPNLAAKEALVSYATASRELALQTEVKPLGRFPIKKHLYGDTKAALFGLALYPSENAAKAFFESNDYRRITPLRDRAFHSLNILMGSTGQGAKEIQSSKSLVLMVGKVNPEESDAMRQYAKGSQLLAQKLGVRPLCRYKVTQQLAGELAADIVGIAEFPSDASVSSYFNSPAYKALLPSRAKAFSSLDIYLLKAN